MNCATETVIFFFLLRTLEGSRMMDHLVALVDAVDELRAWSSPSEANCGRVDSLCLHVPWWYCGDCTTWNEKYRRKDAS